MNYVNKQVYEMCWHIFASSIQVGNQCTPEMNLQKHNHVQEIAEGSVHQWGSAKHDKTATGAFTVHVWQRLNVHWDQVILDPLRSTYRVKLSPIEISWWTQAITKFALTVPNDVSCLTSHSSLATLNHILSRAALGPDVRSSILLCEHAFALLMNMLIRTNRSHIISMLSVHNQTSLYCTTVITPLYAEPRKDSLSASSMRRGVYNWIKMSFWKRSNVFQGNSSRLIIDTRT